MKISGYLKTKERIEIQLDKIDCVYWKDDYFFIFNEEVVFIEESLNDHVLMKNFLFIPGKRLIQASEEVGTTENIITTTENNTQTNYYIDNTKHFINRNNINWFISSKHPSGMNLYKIGVERYISDMKVNENFHFLISSSNITSQMIHHFE